LRRFAWVLLTVTAIVGFAVNRDQLFTPVDEGHYDLKQAGLILRGKVRPRSKIADRKPYLPFYADGVYLEIPTSSYDGTIEYLVTNDVDYLSLHETVIRKFRPMLLPLATNAEVIRGENRFDQFSKIGDFILVYRRNRDAATLDWKPVVDDFGGFDSFPVWSPDGKRIAYVSTQAGNSDIKIISADGGEPQLVVGGPSMEESPAWSPDGKTIVFASNRSGPSDIYTIFLDSAETERVIPQAGTRTSPSWSGDGSEIVFVSHRPEGRVVSIKDLHSGALTRIDAEGEVDYPVLSPGGDRIAWIRKPGRVVIYDRSTGTTTVARTPTNSNYPPAWSPDGAYMAVTAKDWGSVDVYLLSSDGANALLLTKQPGFDGQPDWSSDGRTLVIASNRGDGRGIWTLGGLEPFLARLAEPSEVWTLRSPPAGR
jgi:TolB protein